MTHLIIFLVFGALCVAGAVNLLVQRHPINGALSLVVVMGSLAVEYLLLGAEFVAAVQVIVYAGAIMVLFVFVIMLLNAGEEEHTKGSRVALLFGVPGMLVASVLIGWVLIQHSGTHTLSAGALPGAPRTIGWLLFHNHGCFSVWQLFFGPIIDNKDFVEMWFKHVYKSGVFFMV